MFSFRILEGRHRKLHRLLHGGRLLPPPRYADHDHPASLFLLYWSTASSKTFPWCQRESFGFRAGADEYFALWQKTHSGVEWSSKPKTLLVDRALHILSTQSKCILLRTSVSNDVFMSYLRDSVKAEASCETRSSCKGPASSSLCYKYEPQFNAGARTFCLKGNWTFF